MDGQAALVGSIEQAAIDGVISVSERDSLISQVRQASSDSDLETVRRLLEFARARAQAGLTQTSEAEHDTTHPHGLVVNGEPVATDSSANPLGTFRAGVARFSPVLAFGLLASMFAIGVAITWAYLSMRAVMNVGGACAEGGPYVPVQPCPDGAMLITVAIPVLIISALVGSGLAAALRAPAPLLIMWAGLFGALGWNFYDFAPDMGGPTGYFLAVMFWLMALPAVLAIIGIPQLSKAVTKLRGRSTSTESPWMPMLMWFGAYAVVLYFAVQIGAGWWQRLA